MISYIEKLLCRLFNRSFAYSFCYQYIDHNNICRLGNAIRSFNTKVITIQKINMVETSSKKLHSEIQNNFIVSHSYMGWLKPEEINETV